MPTPVLVAGLPGKMALETALLVAEADDFALAPVAATSQDRAGGSVEIDGASLRLASFEDLSLPEGCLAVDYTTPDAALANARWYAERGVPFVMGTTGFDAAEARRVVEASSVSAVIAPNMAGPIVLLQAAARFLADEFPSAMAGGGLTIRESHQSTKRDTSGTAKAMVASLNELGVDFDVSAIRKVRDADTQRQEIGVPEEHLAGHAFHRYELRAAAGTVGLVLEHNVVGRRVYAEGTVQALRYLLVRRAAGSRGEVFTMEDVLRGFPQG